jgi:hypothetical protein
MGWWPPGFGVSPLMLAPVQAGRQSSECPASGRPVLTVWRTCPVCGDHLPGDRASTAIYCGRACKDTETYLAALERQVEEIAFASTTAGRRAVRRIQSRLFILACRVAPHGLPPRNALGQFSQEPK